MSSSLPESEHEVEAAVSTPNGQRPLTPPTRPHLVTNSASASRNGTTNTAVNQLSDYSYQIHLATFSDSSSDLRVVSTPAQTSATPTQGAASTGNSRAEGAASAAADYEPDWVRNFNPMSADRVKEREAFLALFDDDDDDSVIDLISQELDGNASEEVAKAAEAEKTPSRGKVAKRGKGMKPKSRLPLTVASKLDENLVLLQSEGNGLDLSGDVGAVGRVKIQDGELMMDIKGVVYNALVRKCNSMCVVNVGEEEARVTAVFNEAVTLSCKRNLFDSDEIVVHGQIDEALADLAETGVRDEVVHSSKKRKVSDGNGESKSRGSASSKGLDSNKRVSRASRRRK